MCTVAKDKDNLPTNLCTQNYTGSSGGMEVAGALQVFNNSVNWIFAMLNILGMATVMVS